ncbi:hypothetical protein FEF26_04260 [Nesterenkonia salmonea]|uniref:Uncharacterized protein n=1 Tax=Nesterenkonia salmonea TaxID=1804987 RepID=A0A5R9BDB2_9MICC|nr:hypothetical protein [Nesterenkonia salmonea]TLP98617.1 hypothetical protein FEF26_04260 [Nesterenkonia salmonea]
MIAYTLTDHECATVQQGLEYLSRYSLDAQDRHTAKLLVELFSQSDRISFRIGVLKEFDPGPRVDQIGVLLTAIGSDFDAGWGHFSQGHHVRVPVTMAHIAELAFPIIDQLEIHFGHIWWDQIEQLVIRQTYPTPEGCPNVEEVWDVLSGMGFSGDPLEVPSRG